MPGIYEQTNNRNGNADSNSRASFFFFSRLTCRFPFSWKWSCKRVTKQIRLYPVWNLSHVPWVRVTLAELPTVFTCFIFFSSFSTPSPLLSNIYTSVFVYRVLRLWPLPLFWIDVTTQIRPYALSGLGHTPDGRTQITAWRSLFPRAPRGLRYETQLHRITGKDDADSAKSRH